MAKPVVAINVEMLNYDDNPTIPKCYLSSGTGWNVDENCCVHLQPGYKMNSFDYEMTLPAHDPVIFKDESNVLLSDDCADSTGSWSKGTIISPKILNFKISKAFKKEKCYNLRAHYDQRPILIDPMIKPPVSMIPDIDRKIIDLVLIGLASLAAGIAIGSARAARRGLPRR